MAGLFSLGIPLGFGFPWALLALLALPVIWYLLRLTPPRPNIEPFPPTKVLAQLVKREETPARSPWWLTLLRLLMAAVAIIAMAQPVWNPQNAGLKGEGPILLVIDNGWESGPNWPAQLAGAMSIIDDAQSAKRLIIPIPTVPDPRLKIELNTPEQLRKKLSAWVNHPIAPDYPATTKLIQKANQEFSPTSTIFLSAGLRHEGSEQLSAALTARAEQKILYLPETDKLAIITSTRNNPNAMSITIMRANTKSPQVFRVQALDIKGVSIANKIAAFEQGESKTVVNIEVPVELRNEIVRIRVEEGQNAGAIRLLDESNRRRLIGLISGEKHDNSQPLLSPLYYISRALEPFSDIRRADDANIVKAVPALITNGVSAIILADIGIIPPQTSKKLQTWINRGGTLIRFAGPRLAAAPNNTLLPVEIREGDRNIGGSLSWETPKPVAEFEPGSPFFGLQPPNEVFVSRQVLALQDGRLEDRTWARLTDGTPLVTAQRTGQGWVVLFHVSSDATWSNLPISGTFVDMLRRVVNQSRSFVTPDKPDTSTTLPPLQLLNGQGELIAPGNEAKPLIFTTATPPVVSTDNPPGFYGTADGFRALNLFNTDHEFELVEKDFMGKDTIIAGYEDQNATALKPWALLIVAALLIMDCLAVLWMAGILKSLIPTRQTRPSATMPVIFTVCILTIASLVPVPLSAQENNPDDIDFTPALNTRLAYVITGVASVDETSEAGLRGLTRFLTQRTAVEPAAPIGIDIANDELAFYPMIYWPIHIDSELPDAKTMARIDAYMKQGGSVLFDTRDQISGLLGGTSSSPEAIHLQAILDSLDIPPLEPVPSDHVLTKSFFILAQFPGRYSGGDLWVEQLPDEVEYADRPVRSGDGVSSILITSNDLAGAWAINDRFQPMFAIVPPNPIQRELAFRVGVNLVMYAMTGNYKADQVHIPALLQRLGQ